MKPPPLDAPEAERWAYVYGQIADLHECFESRLNKMLAAISEVKAMALPAFTWTSAEEKQREKDALIEAGKQIERERWRRYFKQAQVLLHEVWDWGGKPAAGAAVLYIVYQVS